MAIAHFARGKLRYCHEKRYQRGTHINIVLFVASTKHYNPLCNFLHLINVFCNDIKYAYQADRVVRV